MQTIKKTRSEYFPMKLKLFDLFYNFASAMYVSPASVALCTARMVHAYLSTSTDGLQAAFEAEGLDLQSIRNGIISDTHNPHNSHYFAAEKLLTYLA